MRTVSTLTYTMHRIAVIMSHGSSKQPLGSLGGLSLQARVLLGAALLKGQYMEQGNLTVKKARSIPRGELNRSTWGGSILDADHPASESQLHAD